MIKGVVDKARWAFGRYIAAESSNRRRDPGTSVKSSDTILTESGRGRLTEGARELWRNYSVVAWAIRKHLDYVSTFSFLPTTDSPALNAELESLMKWWARPLNFDAAARHGLRRYMRLLEARRVIDGDVFLLKLATGKVQAVEGHRVRTPRARVSSTSEYTHGVKVGPGGRMRSIAIHSIDHRGVYQFEREVQAQDVLQLGYFDAFDQLRGVSPLSSAITQYQDVLEVSDYARAKAKVTQLFALAITRAMSDLDDETESSDGYSVDFGRGPVKLELDPGDKAEFLESKHPSTEFLEFMRVTLQAALKSLDIPWSFYDEGYTNFFGSKAALMQYQQSCTAKRDDLREILDRLTVWRMSQWVARGALVLPGRMSVADLSWDWIPAGIPWWDTSKEVKGDLEAISGGLRTRTEIRRERFGDDWRNVVKRLREEEQYMAEIGLALPQPQSAADGDQSPKVDEEDDEQEGDE